MKYILCFKINFDSEGSTDPVEEKKTSLLDMHETSVLSQLLEKYRAAALVGLEFAVEVWWQGERDPRHHCLLCNFQCGIMEFMFHLLSAQHRLNYMVRSSNWFILFGLL